MEYAPNWDETKDRVKAKTRRCCMRPWLSMRDVHHVKYRRSLPRRILGKVFRGNDLSPSNIGYEWIGWDVFPISEKCHHNIYGRSLNRCSVHYTGDNPHWIQDRHDQINNHNVAWLKWRLRITWLILTNKIIACFLFGLSLAIAFYLIGGLILLIRSF